MYETLIKTIEVDGSSSTEKIFADLADHVSYLRHADRVLLDSSSQAQVFESLGRVFAIHDIDPSGTQFFVIADITQSYFRRLLARYMTAAGIQKLFVTEDEHFGSLLTSLLLDKNPTSFEFVKSYSVSPENSKKRLFLSYITDQLLFNGFPLGILSLVLLLPFV